MIEITVENLYQSLYVCLMVSGCWALIVLLKSILDFSRTGPQIKDEVLINYRFYTFYSLLSLTFWVFLISFYLAVIGNYLYISLTIIFGNEFSINASIFWSIFSITFFTCLQFSKHLLFNPTSIMLSSLYSMRKFTKLWEKLSPALFRYIHGFLIAVFSLLIILSSYRLINNDYYDVLIFYSVNVSALLAIYLFSVMPYTMGKPNKHHSTDKPNIIMIGVDTLRADRISKKRKEESITPNIDAFLKRSLFFKNCFVSIARTAPSLVSLMTGILPWKHKIRDNFASADELNLSVKPFPRILNENGYNTAVVSDWCGSDYGKFDFGFKFKDLPEDQWNIRYFIRQGPKDMRLFLSLFFSNRLGRAFLPEIFYLGGVSKGKYLLERSKYWINRLSQEQQPFYLNIFFSTTHPPFGSEYPYYMMYSDKDYGGESKFAMSRLRDPFEIIESQKEPKEAFDLEQILSLYDGSVKNFDDQVSEILDYLNKNGLDKNTIIVIYSDHGMEFFENDTWGQGNSILSDFSYKVPLIISTPNMFKKIETEQIVRTIDIVPTLLEMIGIETKDQYDGQSLLPIAYEKQQLNLDVIGETGIWFSRPPGMKENHLHYPDLLDILEIPDKKDGTIVLKSEYKKSIYEAKDSMIISGKWKLVNQPLATGSIYMLYNRENDPENKVDLSDKFPDIVEVLKKRLEENTN